MGGDLAPKPVRTAVIGIYVLAVLNLDVLWAEFSPSYRSRMDDMLYPYFSGAPSSAQLASARTEMLVILAVFSVAVALLLVWLGVKTRAGRRWACIVVTVIVTLGLLTTLRTVLAPGDQPALAGRLFTLVDLVVRVAVVALLWAPENSRLYFRRRIAP